MCVCGLCGAALLASPRPCLRRCGVYIKGNARAVLLLAVLFSLSVAGRRYTVHTLHARGAAARTLVTAARAPRPRAPLCLETARLLLVSFCETLLSSTDPDSSTITHYTRERLTLRAVESHIFSGAPLP